MSAFTPIGDSANSLRTEGQEIHLSFKQGVPVTGQGTIEWNIPAPANGCTSDIEGVYAGIVFLLRTEPLDASNIPQDGIVYLADPTADFDLSTADRIGDAIVVGAVYECEKKNNGEDLTTTLIINDLKPNVSYYLAGYALDCQNRYHADGQRAYSDFYGNKVTDIPAKQEIYLGSTDGTGGVLPTDGTGLIPTVFYEFDIVIDDTYPNGNGGKTIAVTTDGIDAGTYQDLLNVINQQILLGDNPPQSPTPPNSGGFFWKADDQELFQYDGINYNSIPVVVEPTDPANVLIGSYWFDETNKILNRWNVPNPTGWNVLKYIESVFDPVVPACDSYWIDGTGAPASKWNGSTWCEQLTTISPTDPSDCPTVECGTYWFDKNLSVLNEWNENNLRWEETSALYWPEAPNQLSQGTYWFNDTDSTLNRLSGAIWTDISSTSKIQETQPSVPVDGMLWYKPSTEELKEYSVGSPMGWSLVPVIVWPIDPTVVESCTKWWDSVNDNLFTWDVINSTWNSVNRFVQSTLDPTEPAPLDVDSVWYEPVSDKMYRWDGGDWVIVNHVLSVFDPTSITTAEVWYNPDNNTWKVRDLPNPGWNVIDPINTTFDPTIVPNGTYWFNTSNNGLNVRNGATWTNVLYTTVPFVPVRYSQWFNTTDNVLYEWSGTEWIVSEPIAVASLDSNGNFVLRTRGAGSNNIIMIPTPEGAISATSPCSIGTGFAYLGTNDLYHAQCDYYDNDIRKTYNVREISQESFLWNNITPTPNVLRPNGGNDGKSNQPSYAELGVGDDGTPDERRELMNSIRAQLGYPVVEVELTNYQLDTAITGALESFRKRSSSSQLRGFFLLDLEPGSQKYMMTNKVKGYNKITSIMGAFRFNSAALGTAGGGGVYSQIALQHLYNMGTYDLTSWFLVSQYTELLEDLFATRIMFGFHANTRIFQMHSSVQRPERILLDCMVERTEQDLLTDRFIKTWIERYALSEAMMMLSHIRGKFASLPGAGGGVALNAGELITISQSYREELLAQLEDYVVDFPEDIGMNSSFILG